MADDPVGTVAMGLEAQRQASAHDWEPQKQRYLAIVERLVGGRDAGRRGPAIP
jgi:hypothetical protein